MSESNVLDLIIEGVLEDLASRKIPESQLQEKISNQPKVIDVIPRLKAKEIAVISEIKRSSPSKGQLAEILDPCELAKAYQAGGAAAISVLTEMRRFSGSLRDFDEVREVVDIPMLRKDFLVTEYQVLESRAHGADIQLLIVAALSDSQLKDFYQIGSELGMRTLVEVHTEAELERAIAINPEIIGVNSRNLKTLSVDFHNFEKLIPLIPSNLLKVAESGIFEVEDVIRVKELGADGILVGEALVKDSEPAQKIGKLSI
jgi:indole-3-glycerol phosphate synthase